MRLVLLLCFSAPALPGAYSNLIATSDGAAVYFEVRTGPATTSWYVARGPEVSAVSGPLADIDGSATVQAFAQTLDRSCGFAGSSCWLADYCQATFELQEPGSQFSNHFRTFVRLSRSGEFVWIDQSDCKALGRTPPPQFNGLYLSSSLKLVAAQGSASLASQRYGRRAVTDQGQALTLIGPQLAWLDAAGVHPIRNINGAFEAVTDAQGANIVYIEAGFGKLHWVTGPDWLAAGDRDLGLSGSAPALTDDGATLFFLAADGSLQSYSRASGAVRRVGPDRYSTFTLGGSAVFAVTLDRRLVRIDPAGGTSTDWLAPFPEITSVGAPVVPPGECPYICYGDTDYGRVVTPGMIVTLDGAALGGAGWRVRTGGFEVPLHSLSDTEAWFQIPSALPVGGGLQTLELSNPNLPIAYSMKISVQDRLAVCFGTAHQDFSRLVSPEDTAAIGEIVHVFLTGLRGAEPVPDGVPNPTDHLIPIANPPALAEPSALQQLFFGLAPGLIGMQQLDLRVLATPSTTTLFDYPTMNCERPPVASR